MGLYQRLFQREEAEQSYAPLDGGSERPDGARIQDDEQREYSRTDYYVFLLLGVAMLWAWCASGL
jgi:equilibrative nucleoside transporter 1/2/3